MITRIPHDWEKQNFYSWRAYARSCVHQNLGKKNSDLVRIESDLLASSGESLVEVKLGTAVAHCGDKDTGGGSSGECSLA